MSDAVRGDGVLQRTRNMLLADDFGKGLRTPFAGKYLIDHKIVFK